MPLSLPFGRKRLPSSERLHANPPRYPEPAGPRADGERRHQDFLMAPPDSLLHLTHMLELIPTKPHPEEARRAVSKGGRKHGAEAHASRRSLRSLLSMRLSLGRHSLKAGTRAGLSHMPISVVATGVAICASRA